MSLKYQIQNQQKFQIQNWSNDAKIQHSHKFIQFDKIYKNENKFNETNDNFNFKFNIFINKCNRVDFFMKTWFKIVSIMLSNQKQTFYYANQSIITTWFDFEISMKKFFEKFEWHRMNLIKWQIVNLIDIISLNLILSTVECFRKLVIKMNILQRNIDFQFDDQFHFRKKIIWIVRDHSAFLIEFISSADNVINLINNLQNLIMNYKAMHRSFTHEIYVQFYKNDEKKNWNWKRNILHRSQL